MVTSATQNALRQISTQSNPLAFRASPMLCGEPTKRKKKMDVNLLQQRENKRKKKLEKLIRRLEAKGRILKPVEEISGEPAFLKTLESRMREGQFEDSAESERRALLVKKWSSYKFKQNTQQLRSITAAIVSQERALQELKFESEELYQEAVKLDDHLIPFKCYGPTLTPPIKGYDPADGEYIDTTRKFDK